MITKKLVSIIIPAYNEEKNIAKVIRKCHKLKKDFQVEIIVVDGGSQDKTIQVAKKERADKIIKFPYKRGKGADFWAGGIIANGAYIIQIDSDYQFLPQEIPLFVDKLEKETDVVIGTRFVNSKIEKGSISTRNLFGNKFLSLLTSLACGQKITDVMAGFKGFRKKAFLALDIRERHFEYEAEIIVKAMKMGMRLEQIPVSYKKRIGGNSGIRVLNDGLKVIMAIIKVKLAKLPNYREL